MQNWVDVYLEERVLKNVTLSTLQDETGILRRFKRFLEQVGVEEISRIETGHILGYFASMRNRGVSAATCYGSSNVIRRFFESVIKNDGLLMNPFPEDFKIKNVKNSRRALSLSEMQRLLRKWEASNHPLRVRNVAILELVYGTGLRAGELARLNLGDYCSDELRVYGKGRKERIVPVGQQAKYWLDKYLYEERIEVAQRYESREDALFLTRVGNRCRRRTFGSITKPEKFCLHQIRTSCATHMLENGAPILSVSKLLGHEYLSTTAIYTKVTTRNLKTLLKKYHPREQS